MSPWFAIPSCSNPSQVATTIHIITLQPWTVWLFHHEQSDYHNHYHHKQITHFSSVTRYHPTQLNSTQLSQYSHLNSDYSLSSSPHLTRTWRHRLELTYLPRQFLLDYIADRHVLSCHVLSCHVLSCLCLVLSRLVLSCLVLSCLVFHYDEQSHYSTTNSLIIPSWTAWLGQSHKFLIKFYIYPSIFVGKSMSDCPILLHRRPISIHHITSHHITSLHIPYITFCHFIILIQPFSLH